MPIIYLLNQMKLVVLKENITEEDCINGMDSCLNIKVFNKETIIEKH